MRKKQFQFIVSLVVVILVAAFALQTFSHCQIPCGIYDDDVRFKMLNEHITTIEKSMNSIVDIQADDPGANANQLVRWIQNKDNHADAFTEIVTQYFLSQRIKPSDENDKDYTHKLVLLHTMMVHSMKAKQTTDLAHVEALRKLVKEFQSAYNKK